jgi:uncharacterized membrane protein
MTFPGNRRYEAGPQLERLVFFSDAVFAIAMTLLVIDIRIPDLAGQPGGPAALDVLQRLVPRILTFALSFAVVGLYWVGHHRIFGAVRAYDGRVIALNFAMLFFVVLVPFPTSFISAYGDDPAGPALYALTNAGAGGLEAILWLYLAWSKYLDPAITDHYARFRFVYYLRAPLVFLASIPIAIWIGPHIAELSWLALFVLGVVVRLLFPTESGHQPEHGGQLDE